MRRALVAGLFLLALFISPAAAHKVILAVYASGDVIEGEVGFSNGDMATDQLVEIFDETGEKLGEATTDADGFFTFTPTAPVTHVFRADMGAGHVAQAVMPVADLPAGLASNAASATPVASRPAAAEVATPPGPALDEAKIAEMIRDEIKPLRREIAAYREKNDLQTILGGIGYILGLVGIAYYIAARRKLKDTGK